MNTSTHMVTQFEITFWSILIKALQKLTSLLSLLVQFFSNYSLEFILSLAGLLLGLSLGIVITMLKLQ